MKKRIAFLMAAMLLMGCTACTSANKPAGDDSAVVSTTDNTAETPAALLSAVWDKYTEEELFPVIGGDFSEENNNPNGPGRYSIEDAEALDGTLLFPAASVAKLEDAASLLHMMNANTFTSAAFRVKAEESAAAVADEIAANVRERQWMCGMPDKFVIYTIGQDVVLVLGASDLTDTFCGKFEEVYPAAAKTVDELIAVE